MPFPTPYPPAAPVISTTQRFSRRGVGFLWNKRNDLDPGQVAILNALYNNRKKSSIECEQTITYKLAKSKAGQLGYGRYYGTKGSLETLEKECRGTICHEYYHDIDIKNCHPVLLSQLARTYYEKDLPENDFYVANRDKVLSAISSNREEAKEELIRILYGGTNKHDITAKLSAEVRAFSKYLTTLPEHAALFAAVKHEDNIYGKFLSLLLQTEERRCMLALKESLETAGWSVDVLAYDGVMVRKREGHSIAQAMRAAEQAIKTATGYDVELTDKEFSSFEVPKTEEEIVKGVPLSAYEDMKARFEQTHFYHVPSGTFARCTDEGIIFMKKDHARDTLNTEWHFTHSEKFGDYTPFFDLWLKDPNRRNIDEISMKPSDNPRIFSPPLKWAYQTVDSVDDEMSYVKMFLDFLTKLVPEAAMREYLLEWFAHVLQKPFENPKSGVFLVGEKGCGKDTLGDFMSDFVIGSRYSMNYDDNEQFWAPHDTGRLNKLFVKLEEADGQYMRKYYSKLKAIITTDKTTFNPKGVKEIHTNNYNRFLFTTNDHNPVPTESGERRFSIILCGTSLVGKIEEFWRPLRQKLFTPEGGRAVANYLLELPIGQFPRVLQATLAQEMMADAQKSPEDRFLEEWDGAECTAAELYQLFCDYCIENSLPKWSASSLSFGKKLIRPVANGTVLRRHTATGNYYRKP